jgi:ribosomal 50S subunit-recycling heat shock protein
MRLDLFLKLSRLCPRRTVAQKLCDAGFVLLNGRVAKPAHEVHAGDQITIRTTTSELGARVTSLPVSRNVSRHNAKSLVEITHKKVTESVGEPFNSSEL